MRIETDAVQRFAEGLRRLDRPGEKAVLRAADERPKPKTDGQAPKGELIVFG
jgi:hypothetical protein